MKIAVIGAGAIGALVAGYLKLNGEEVYLIGRPASVKALSENGLRISGARGNFVVNISVSERLDRKTELVILATKSQDIAQAIEDNLEFIHGSMVLTTQNGVQADTIASQYLAKENIISSIVMFGSTSLQLGEIVHNFEGNWIIGKAFGINDESVRAVSKVLNTIFPVMVAENIKGMKYLKVFVNANNCIPAILGMSMQDAFSDTHITRISMGVWKEGLDIVQKSGIQLVSLPDFPLDALIKLTTIPLDEAAKIYSGIMSNLSKEPLYGSILQSIKRGKASEIDYINGEFVALAKANKINASLNARLVEMVHEVEKNRSFFTKEDLIENTKGLFN